MLQLPGQLPGQSCYSTLPTLHLFVPSFEVTGSEVLPPRFHQYSLFTRPLFSPVVQSLFTHPLFTQKHLDSRFFFQPSIALIIRLSSFSHSTTKLDLSSVIMSKQEPLDQIKFLVSCIGHSSNGRVSRECPYPRLPVLTVIARLPGRRG